MSLEFKWLDNSRDIDVIYLDDMSLLEIQPALNKLEEKTGLQIDPYSDTRISPDHACLLIENIKSLSIKENSQINGLIILLEASSKNSRWILAVGD